MLGLSLEKVTLVTKVFSHEDLFFLISIALDSTRYDVNGNLLRSDAERLFPEEGN